MQFATIFRLIGLLLILFSMSMLTPLLINFIFHEPFWFPFLASFLCTFGVGLTLWLRYRDHRYELKIRDGFLIVVLFWVVLCGFASLPFLFALPNHQTLTDALFESVAGMTTTGASVFAQLDSLPHAVLFYRQQLQFLGGMGIIVLAVAILPMLGMGGMQLYRNELSGPMKDAKLTPRLAQTAKALWFIYCLLTLLCMLSYWASGMNWFDALGESFATVSTGGFSMHSQGFSFYNNDLINISASVFMLLGGTNFALHFIVLQKRSLKYYWQDEEFRYYLSFLLLISVGVTLNMIMTGRIPANGHALLINLFNVISLSTTTGITVSSTVSGWPNYAPLLFMLLGIIGGCAASTSGGIKVLRALLIYKQSKRELVRLLHPQAITPIKFGNRTLPEPILQSMWGFISVFIALFIMLLLLLMALGHDFITAFSAVTASLANTGAGFWPFNIDFATLDTPSKWILIVAMLAGRLEIFSILVLFSRQFWKK